MNEILLPVLIVAGIGLLAWVRRRIRKKRIEGLFARRA